MRCRSVFLLPVVYAVGACGFAAPGAATDGSDQPGDVATEDAPPAHDGGVDSALDATPDAATSVCVGSPVNVCGIPSGQGKELTAAIDTDSGLCEVGFTATIALGSTTNVDACVISGTTIRVSGYVPVSGSRPLILLASQSITVDTGSWLSASSGTVVSGGAFVVGASAAAQPCTPTTATGNSGGAGGSFGALGGSGGKGAKPTSMTTGASPVISPTSLRGGCPGGAGGNGGGAPGMPGGALVLIAPAITLTGGVIANGDNGGGASVPAGGSDGQGGGGGGSGGMIAIEASASLTATGYVLAQGGGGGEGGSDDRSGSPGKEVTLPANGMDTVGPAEGGSGNSTIGGGGGPGGQIGSGGGGGGGGSSRRGNSKGGGGGGGGGAGIIYVHVAPGGMTTDTLQIFPAPTPVP